MRSQRYLTKMQTFQRINWLKYWRANRLFSQLVVLGVSSGILLYSTGVNAAEQVFLKYGGFKVTRRTSPCEVWFHPTLTHWEIRYREEGERETNRAIIARSFVKKSQRTYRYLLDLKSYEI
ncbi:hypothetical protein [Chroococcidiopsis thermalis]|nr:hypothetical protein [Chroococcidiopsis thermalis]